MDTLSRLRAADRRDQRYACETDGRARRLQLRARVCVCRVTVANARCLRSSVRLARASPREGATRGGGARQVVRMAVAARRRRRRRRERVGGAMPPASLLLAHLQLALFHSIPFHYVTLHYHCSPTCSSHYPILFHSTPFHSISFRYRYRYRYRCSPTCSSHYPIPLHSTPFHSIPLHSIPLPSPLLAHLRLAQREVLADPMSARGSTPSIISTVKKTRRVVGCQRGKGIRMMRHTTISRLLPGR